jgi:hypothetical protein
MLGRKKKDEDPVMTLARCIGLLDDIRAYRRKDVEKIDGVFTELKKSRFREHYEMWIKLRPSAEDIVDMPMNVKGVPELIRTLAWVKVGSRVALIVLVFFIAMMLVPAWKQVLGNDPFEGNGFLYATASVVAMVILMNASQIIDYRIRKKIIAYEEETTEKFKPAREKMKGGVDKMMYSLAREASRKGVDRRNFGLVLYFDDYNNMEVVDQWKPKSIGLFKKSYNHYQVLPKL